MFLLGRHFGGRIMRWRFVARLLTPERYAKVQEKFGSAATYSRLFDATPAQTCEAARRALLSQGYIVNKADQETVEGQKSFQPQPDRHVQMNIRVTCVPESSDGGQDVRHMIAASAIAKGGAKRFWLNKPKKYRQQLLVQAHQMRLHRQQQLRQHDYQHQQQQQQQQQQQPQPQDAASKANTSSSSSSTLHHQQADLLLDI